MGGLGGQRELEALGRRKGGGAQLGSCWTCSDPTLIFHMVSIFVYHGLSVLRENKCGINVRSLFTQHVNLFKFP